MATIKIEITGPQGSGKSTVAAAIARMLLDEGRDAVVIDGDDGEVSMDEIEARRWPAGEPPKNNFEIVVKS